MGARLASVGLFSLAVALAGSANATSDTLAAMLDGLREEPPTASLGTGILTGSYDHATNALTWSDLWHLDIHGSGSSEGEIRGQVPAVPVSEPMSLGLAGLGLFERRHSAPD